MIRGTVTTSLGSFVSRIPTSITTLQGMFLSMAEENPNSQSSPITSFYCPSAFTLSNGRFTFPTCYLTFKSSPYWAAASNYGCSPIDQNGYWYFNMDGYYSSGLYGKTYWIIAYY